MDTGKWVNKKEGADSGPKVVNSDFRKPSELKMDKPTKGATSKGGKSE